MYRFINRHDAGRHLASLINTADYIDPVVIALPRGGVPVAAEIAKSLYAPLELLHVRKIGVPGQPEVALGAVVEGNPNEIVINDDIRESLAVNERALAEGIEQAKQEISVRRALYTPDHAALDLQGRTAIIVDDGIATGATIRAALLGVRHAAPSDVVLAVGVAPPETLESLESLTDEIICAIRPQYLGSVGEYYDDFSQVEDQAVIDALANQRRYLLSISSTSSDSS